MTIRIAESIHAISVKNDSCISVCVCVSVDNCNMENTMASCFSNMKTVVSSPNSHRWTSIHDQYQTLEVLGQGTYGVVYKAEHKITKNIVGLKRCRLDTFKDFGIPETTLREVSLLRDLRHENIMTLYHISCNTVRLYMVCEYLDQDLKKYIRSHQNGIPLNEIKYITFSILQGLAFCHGHRIIHRDLKPVCDLWFNYRFNVV
jgi:serine/threonine protein kinase